MFSGIGGLDLGVRAVLGNHRTLAYCERSIEAASVLEKRASEGLLDEAPIYSDVKSFPTELYSGKVDWVIGGFPCQPFSTAGKRAGEFDSRNLWPDTIRLIRELGPRYVFLENVPGLVTSGYFGTILGDLAEARLDAEWGCFTAAQVGASSWPTARTHEHFQGIEATNAYVDAGYRQPKTRGKKTRQGGTFDTTLSTAAAAKHWPTPTGREYKDGTSAHTVPENGLLGRQAPNWENSRNSHQDRETHDGNGSSNTTQNSHQHGASCMRLNPKFVTWMMLGKSRIGWLR